MEINRLRSIIRESISNNLKEIEDVAENAAMEAKLNAYTEAIEKVNKKIEMAESLEEMQELVDPTKLNELKKHLKTLEKSKEKLEKVKAKKNKGKEVVTDEPVEESEVEEIDNWNAEEVDDPWDAGQTKNQPMDEVDLSDEEKEELRKKAEQNPSLALPEAFLKMQKLAGVITEAQYNQKKSLIENQLGEISLSGTLDKLKDKITNSPAFNKIIDTIVLKMSEEDKKNFLAKFNLSESKGIPSLEDIMSKVDAANPNKDAKTPEELTEGWEDIVDTVFAQSVRLVRNLTGINLLALGGIPLGAIIAGFLGHSWGAGTAIGGAISLIASLIIHKICSKILGYGENDELVD